MVPILIFCILVCQLFLGNIIENPHIYCIKESNGVTCPENPLCFIITQLCSTYYTAVQILKIYLCNQSINTMKNMDNFHLRKPSRANAKLFLCQQGTQRRTLVSTWRMPPERNSRPHAWFCHCLTSLQPKKCHLAYQSMHITGLSEGISQKILVWPFWRRFSPHNTLTVWYQLYSPVDLPCLFFPLPHLIQT